MQNRYTGDIGDFGKLGLLRCLHSHGLSIGVNWYLIPDEIHNGDGRHVGYLEKDGYRECDQKLWDELKRIVDSGKRAVSSLQKEEILQAAYYSKILDNRSKTKPERTTLREEWHKNALEYLRGLDVIFLDPDNGLIVSSAEGTPKANKFVEPGEVAAYFKQGSSVVYYQHKARKKDSFYIDQHEHLLAEQGLKRSSGLGLKFVTTSQRYYFFLIQPQHGDRISMAVESMLDTPWKAHFCQLD